MTEIQDLNYMNNDLAKRAEQHSPYKITETKREKNSFYFTFENDVELKVDVLTNDVFNFRYAEEGRYSTERSFATDPKFKSKKAEVTFRENDLDYHILTKSLRLEINKQNGLKKIFNSSGELLNEDEKGYHWEYHHKSGNNIVLMSKKIQSGEHFYGLGDKTGHLDLRGRKLQLWGSDTYAYDNTTDPLYKNIPFFISLHSEKSYGIFFDNTFRTFFDFGEERGNVYSFWAHGGEMNYYFIYGPEMLDVSSKYTLLTGTPELPPLWSLGFHQCKWSYFPEKKVKEIVNGFREREIPCDAIYLDIDYMDGFRCFTWSKEHFPDPKGMIQEFKEKGFKTVVIIDPGIKIDKDYWVYNEGIKNNYFCRRADGPRMKGSVWPGLCNFPDFTRQDVRDWWGTLFKGLVEDGVAGVWNDMNEPAVFEDGTFPDDVRFDNDGSPCSHKKAHNIYGQEMAKSTYLGLKKIGYPNRPFVITRSGYAGLQKYSSVWTGDNKASWEHLKIANTQCQRLSVSGVSFTGSDIGGFIETPTGELFARWIQLGIFHPFCRVHSSGDHNDQEPWSFGDDITAIVKKFIELRYQLLPYIYTSFWQHTVYGTPMLRPLSFLDQRDHETYYRQSEFGLGDHLLICPVTEEEADGRWMYLPKGEWFCYWNEQKHSGNQEIWAEADLEQIPLFIKAGAILPFYPIQQYVGEKKIEQITLHLYYSDTACVSLLYQDRGQGYDYLEKDDSCLCKFHVSNEDGKLKVIQKKTGTFIPEYDTYKIVLHGFTKISAVTVDNNSRELNPTLHNNSELPSLEVSFSFNEIEIS